MDLSNDDMHSLLSSLPRKARSVPGARPEGPAGSDGVTFATKDELQALYDRAQMLSEARERIVDSRPACLYVQRRMLVALSLLFFAAGSLAGYSMKEGPRSELPPQETPILLIDLRTGKVFRQFDTETDTLQDQRVARALWCPECRKWHPGPSQEAARNLPNGRAACPVHTDVTLRTHE